MDPVTSNTFPLKAGYQQALKDSRAVQGQWLPKGTAKQTRNLGRAGICIRGLQLFLKEADKKCFYAL